MAWGRQRVLDGLNCDLFFPDCWAELTSSGPRNTEALGGPERAGRLVLRPRMADIRIRVEAERPDQRPGWTALPGC